MDKLHQVFKFLSRNHNWNAAFQINEYRRYLSHWETPKQRINALLHMVAHTQSSPKLETLAAFWQHMEAAPWASEPPSLIQLAEYIQQRSQLVIVSAEPWDRLFRVLLNVAGWGPKTAALFVKCVVNVHRSDVTELHFLRDATIAQTLAAKDRIYLPVDAVIKRIFKEIPMAGVGNTFDSINGVLQKAKEGLHNAPHDGRNELRLKRAQRMRCGDVANGSWLEPVDQTYPQTRISR